MPKRQLTGEIVSAKTKNTAVVSVEKIKEHKKYKKRFKFHQKYKAHFEEGEYQPGEKVVIEETRPISRDKRWKIVKKV
jgi:small subunit ribosomal protein S17